MLASKLYGYVVLIGFRPVNELVLNDPKYGDLTQNKDSVEIAGVA